MSISRLNKMYNFLVYFYTMENPDNIRNNKYLTETLETLSIIPEDINLRVLARRAWEIYSFHQITSYGSISRILHVDIDMVERLLSVGHHLNKKEGQYGN